MIITSFPQHPPIKRSLSPHITLQYTSIPCTHTRLPYRTTNGRFSAPHPHPACQHIIRNNPYNRSADTKAFRPIIRTAFAPVLSRGQSGLLLRGCACVCCLPGFIDTKHIERTGRERVLMLACWLVADGLCVKTWPLLVWWRGF